MIKIFFTVLLIFLSISKLSAQIEEPKNNLGLSLTQLNSKFPELRFTKTDSKGDQYMDGIPQDGIALFFYIKNNVVIEECMIIQTQDNFPHMWYEAMKNSFSEKGEYSDKTLKTGHCQFIYSYFLIDLIFESEDGNNTALIVYSFK